jgi:hypothetical protein
MVRDNRHDSVHLVVAICHARGVGAAIVMPTTNTEAMNEHPKEISTEVLPGALAVLVSDDAGWDQQGKRVRMPHNTTLLRPPPYSPELNSMQNIWDDRRGSQLSRRVWATYADINAACKDAWHFLTGDKERIASIARRSWACVNHQGGWH